MMITPRVLAVAFLVAPVFAGEPPGFAIWKSSELRQRDAALSKMVGPDHSARETLADYGDHRFRILYRDADGVPEQHDNIVDVVIVQSGEGTLLVGGTMINPRASSGVGECSGQRDRRWGAALPGTGRCSSYSRRDSSQFPGAEG